MSTVVLIGIIIGIILICFGLIYIMLVGFGKISDEIATFETQILKLKSGRGLILIAFGIIILGVVLIFAGEPNSSPPTPATTPTSTSTTPLVTVKITEPKAGSDFPLLDTSKLVGIISYVPDDQHLWIVMLEPPNHIYYPFPDEPAIYGDTWETISYGVGEDNEEQDGAKFIIGAYLLDEKAYEEIKEYVKKSAATDTWEGMYPLPEGATEYDYVRVIGRN